MNSSSSLPVEIVSLPDINNFPVYLIFQMYIIIFGIFALPFIIFFTILNLVFYKYTNKANKKFHLIWSISIFLTSILSIVLNFNFWQVFDYSKCKGFPNCLVQMPQPWLFYLFIIFVIGFLGLPHWFFVWRKLIKSNSK